MHKILMDIYIYPATGVWCCSFFNYNIINKFHNCLFILLLLFCLFYFKSSIVYIQCNISFRCTIQWFNTSIQHLVLITSALLNPHHLFLPSPTLLPSGNHQFVRHSWVCFSICLTLSLFLSLCSLVSLLKFHIWVKSYGICLSLIDLFCLA